jgi:hypothetical protein
MGAWAALALAAVLLPATAFGDDGPPDPPPPTPGATSAVQPALPAPPPSQAAEPQEQTEGRRRLRRKGTDAVPDGARSLLERLRDRRRNRQHGDQ